MVRNLRPWIHVNEFDQISLIYKGTIFLVKSLSPSVSYLLGGIQQSNCEDCEECKAKGVRDTQHGYILLRVPVNLGRGGVQKKWTATSPDFNLIPPPKKFRATQCIRKLKKLRTFFVSAESTNVGIFQ